MDSRWSLSQLFGRWVGLDVLGTLVTWGKCLSPVWTDTLLLGLGLPHTVFLGPSIFPCSVWL